MDQRSPGKAGEEQKQELTRRPHGDWGAATTAWQQVLAMSSSPPAGSTGLPLQPAIIPLFYPNCLQDTPSVSGAGPLIFYPAFLAPGPLPLLSPERTLYSDDFLCNCKAELSPGSPPGWTIVYTSESPPPSQAENPQHYWPWAASVSTFLLCVSRQLSFLLCQTLSSFE